MPYRLSEDNIPNRPLADREFLWELYHQRGWSARTIAYELDVSKSHVTVQMDRLGVLKHWTTESVLRHLYVERGLSVDEIAARDDFNCSPVTVKRYVAEYGLSDTDPEEVTYGRLDTLGNDEPTSA